MKPLDFYFDFSSPYGYLAAEQIEALAARTGRQVTWRPILLGAVFKITGAAPLTTSPLKSDYALKDFRRSAAYYGVPYRAPSHFPIVTVQAARATLWAREHAPERYKALALAFFRAYFREDRDLSQAEVVAEVLGREGFDAQAVLAACGEEAVKAALRTEVDAAIARGVFGSPFFIAEDGEPFWGADRLPMLEAWLTRGGWAY
ncbi:MAG: 2-hydroxychromene-2-carboxylate isomerase [Casimicrobiaceae bacterium]|nr:2-hydroxychromene-2-carboxylate isomerase [Casimicrobiaceae bacterium]MCX8097633.1 2-hydroxychromene-2-carboxylate isomerase [Casimicrobiaceae bacterium]